MRPFVFLLVASTAGLSSGSEILTANPPPSSDPVEEGETSHIAFIKSDASGQNQTKLPKEKLPTSSLAAATKSSKVGPGETSTPRPVHSYLPPRGFRISARVHTSDADGLSYFDASAAHADGAANDDALTIPYQSVSAGWSSTDDVDVRTLSFSHAPPGHDPDTFHPASRGPALLVCLSPTEVSVSGNSADGCPETRRFEAGEAVLLEDDVGRGHKVRGCDGGRMDVLYLRLPGTADGAHLVLGGVPEAEDPPIAPLSPWGKVRSFFTGGEGPAHHRRSRAYRVVGMCCGFAGAMAGTMCAVQSAPIMVTWGFLVLTASVAGACGGRAAGGWLDAIAAEARAERLGRACEERERMGRAKDAEQEKGTTAAPATERERAAETAAAGGDGSPTIFGVKHGGAVHKD